MATSAALVAASALTATAPSADGSTPAVATTDKKNPTAPVEGATRFNEARVKVSAVSELKLGIKHTAKLLKATLDEKQSTDLALISIATRDVNQNAEKSA